MMRITKPEPGDYPAYYKPYVDAVPEEEVMTYFVRSQSEVPEFLRQTNSGTPMPRTSGPSPR